MEAVVTLLRLFQVEKIVGFKKSTIYKKMSEGTFPQAVRLSSKSVAWRSDAISEWIESLPIANDNSKSCEDKQKKYFPPLAATETKLKGRILRRP